MLTNHQSILNLPLNLCTVSNRRTPFCHLNLFKSYFLFVGALFANRWGGIRKKKTPSSPQQLFAPSDVPLEKVPRTAGGPPSSCSKPSPEPARLVAAEEGSVGMHKTNAKRGRFYLCVILTVECPGCSFGKPIPGKQRRDLYRPFICACIYHRQAHFSVLFLKLTPGLLLSNQGVFVLDVS